MTKEEREQFTTLLSKFQQEVHQVAVDKGWHDPSLGPVKTFLEETMLMVSEISEAAEAARTDRPVYYLAEGNKPDGVAAELADTVLRILDSAESRGIPVVKAILEKHDYNKTRPIRHGKKF